MDAQALGRLPGDLAFRRDGLTVHMPLAMMLLLSAGLTVLLSVVSRLLCQGAVRQPRRGAFDEING